MCDLNDGGGDCGIVIPCLQLRNDGAADDADLAVGQNALEAVAGLDAAFAVLNGEDQDDAAVGSLSADLPFVFEGCGEIFDRLAVEGLHRDHGDLGMGLAIDLQAERVQGLDGLRREDSSEVADVVGGLGKVLHPLGAEEWSDDDEEQKGKAARIDLACISSIVLIRRESDQSREDEKEGAQSAPSSIIQHSGPTRNCYFVPPLMPWCWSSG